MKVNPNIVFRREKDGTGLLFDSESGKVMGMNHVSRMIWELLERGESPELILRTLKDRYPEEKTAIERDLRDFLAELESRGLIADR